MQLSDATSRIGSRQWAALAAAGSSLTAVKARHKLGLPAPVTTAWRSRRRGAEAVFSLGPD
jgi:hypothetical protein